VEGKAGSLIIFDTQTWHKAGIVSSGERRVMRGHTRPKEEVVKPNFLRRVLNRIKWNFDQEKIGIQLSSIYKNAMPGDEIVMLTGHAGENDKKYMPAFMATFKNKIRIGQFVESSMFGEPSLGVEQAYYAVR